MSEYVLWKRLKIRKNNLDMLAYFRPFLPFLKTNRILQICPLRECAYHENHMAER